MNQFRTALCAYRWLFEIKPDKFFPNNGVTRCFWAALNGVADDRQVAICLTSKLF